MRIQALCWAPARCSEVCVRVLLSNRPFGAHYQGVAYMNLLVCRTQSVHAPENANGRSEVFRSAAVIVRALVPFVAVSIREQRSAGVRTCV